MRRELYISLYDLRTESFQHFNNGRYHAVIRLVGHATLLSALRDGLFFPN